MKRLLVTAVLLLISTASADIDLVSRDDASYIIWSLDDRSAYLARVSDEYHIVSLGDFFHVSLSIISSDSTEYLAAGCTNEIWWLDPGYLMVMDIGSMEVLNSREISVDNMGFQAGANAFDEIHLDKYSSGSDSCLIVCSTHCCVTDQSFYSVYIASCFVDFSDTGSIILYDTLSTEIHNYAYSMQPFFGPLSTQQLRHLSVTAHCTACPMSHFQGSISSHLHQITPISRIDEMWSHRFYIVYTTGGVPFDLGLVGAGSSSSESVVLWEDTSGVMQYSVFTDSIAPDATYGFPFTAPAFSNTVAMSGNPEDSGLLLVWYDSSLQEIRARHYESEWNDFNYVIASCPSGISHGNIAVYSVTDGYYIAWLPDGATQPELVFVDRATVTGIHDGQESPLVFPIVNISSNPFTECVSLTLENAVSVEELLVFDMSGRIVRSLKSTDSGSFHWDGSNTQGSSVSSGVYIVLGISEYRNVSARLVKI
ncbi:MAG: hypothetical protein K8S15_02945 [Candidatus Aegiribacteria sp.]|nr:hypothetical protein [Candidatus Aegiribacteria sp.]